MALTATTKRGIRGCMSTVSAATEVINTLNNWVTPATTAVTATSAELNLASGLLASSAEINRKAKLSTRLVSLTISASITTALHADRVLVMNATGSAKTFTLPAATGTGTRFKFYVGTVNTSNYIIATAAGDFFAGNILTNSSADAVTTALEPWISLYTTSNITITLNGSTTGGLSIGDWVEVVDIAANTWSVTGVTTSNGTEATPFST